MLEYRVYVLDTDGSITGKLDLLCADDVSAARKVESLLDGHALELWEGTRRIATFEPRLGEAMRQPAKHTEATTTQTTTPA
jgi:hypothetical protein